MKIVFTVLVILISTTAFSAVKKDSTLVFDKRYTRCENKWVVLQKKEDTDQYTFGFIYIDRMAGFTFDRGGTFRIIDNKLVPDTSDKKQFSLKVRIQPNFNKVALLPDTKRKELGLADVPDWLDIYTRYTDTLAHNIRWGFHYNHNGDSEMALLFLEETYKRNPHLDGLEFELAYAYNALKQFEKAITILDGAIKNNPGNCLFYKELSYAQILLDKLEEAETTCTKGLETCSDEGMKAEIAYNLAYHYYLKKDKPRFNVWGARAMTWTDAESKIAKSLMAMEARLKN